MKQKTAFIIAATVIVTVVGLWALCEAVWRLALHNRGW